MLQKFKEQLPVIIITAAVVIGAAWWLNQKTVQEMDMRAEARLATQRQEFDARMKASSDDTRRQIEAVDDLLKDAIAQRSADVFMTNEEVAKLNQEKVDQLAEAIAQKVQPYNPLPKTPEEAEQMQNEQIDKVSGRMVDRIKPILDEMASDQNLTRDSIASYSQRISDQVGRVLTSEMAKNQQLNNNLMTTQSIADDSLKLSHELTALYLAKIRDEGLVTRLLSLPANVVKDTASGSFITNSERKAKEDELMAKMAEIDQRLQDIRAQAPKY